MVFDDELISLGCFCEHQFEAYGSDLELKTWLHKGTQESVCA
jgi:hypothetical protein